jgi:hypothetical protein
MPAFIDFFTRIAKQIRESPREQPTAIQIPPDHCDLPDAQITPFVSNDHYFQVRVNELYLRTSRQWFKEIDPLVFVVSEFIYKAEMRSMPFVVGPELVKQKGQEIPTGMLLCDTRVAGLHPYRGGRLTLTVALCETVQKNHARALLKVVESAAGALDYATMVAPYLKIGSVVLEGIEALFNSGDTVPLVALRKEFDLDANDAVAPGYFVLINAPKIDPKTLWVRKGQLLRGKSQETAEPFTEADFVLYSLVRPATGDRSDLSLLPFYEQWQRVKSEASKPSDDAYKSAKANMFSLYEALLLSPDLTRSQANKLADEYNAEMEADHKRALRFSPMGGDKGEESDLEAARARALAAVEL